MPRTKGSRNGYTKYPGKYTPVGKKADYGKIFEDAVPYDDFEKRYNDAVESGRLSYDDLHPTSKIKYPNTNTNSFRSYHDTKGEKEGKKNNWQQRANRASSYGTASSNGTHMRQFTANDPDRYVNKKKAAADAHRRELRANTQKAAAASAVRNSRSDIGNALHDFMQEWREHNRTRRQLQNSHQRRRSGRLSLRAAVRILDKISKIVKR